MSEEMEMDVMDYINDIDSRDRIEEGCNYYGCEYVDDGMDIMLSTFHRIISLPDNEEGDDEE